ncbi:MAG: YjbH domain-containing protein [Candidatus Eremiobacteraeota bacterium]|nr:YjbH domain-containing protein [Candidatus Eremiobacteraeota bacterium]
MKNIKLIIVFLIISAMLILSPLFAFARENRTGNWNFNETTGLINIPTARTIEARTIKLSIRMARMGKNPPLKKKDQSPNPGSFTGTPLDSDWWIDNNGDRVFLISPFKNFELSLMNMHSYTITPSVGVKWVAINEKKNWPALAIGANNMTGVEEDSNVKSKEVRDANSKVAPFIVASKTFFENKDLDLTVGIGGGRFRKRVFYGGEFFIDKRKIFSAVGEYDGNISSYGIKIRPYKSRWDFGAFMQDVDSPGVTINYKIIY